MPWVRLDDALGDDPRIATAGAVGAGALLLALCYSNRNLTDGWIPEAVLRRILREGSTDEAADEAKGRLLQAKLLFEEAKSGLLGYQIEADYVLLQPTREEVLKQRAGRSRQKSDAGRLGGIASGKARREADAKHTRSRPEAERSTDEAPVPDPDPLRTKSTDAIASAPKPIREFEIATQAQLCKVFDEVLRKEPHSDEAERKEAFRQALAAKSMKADPNDPQALRKAMDIVERGHELTGGFGARDAWFRQIADRRAFA